MDFCLLLKVWVKNISKNFSGKYSQELLDHAKQCVTDAFKTVSRKIIQKLAEATGYLIGNKILTLQISLMTVILRGCQKLHNNNNSESATKKHDKDKPKERCISIQIKNKKLLMN